MSVGGVVLAAGESRRMGMSKALLRVGGETFLDAMVAALCEGGCHPVLAVVAQPVEPIRQRCRLTGVRLVENQDPSLGPISSLRCALGVVQAMPEVSGLVVVLVDQGRIEADSVRQVRQALDHAAVVVASFHGRPGHPTAFDRPVFAALLDRRADAGARVVVDAQRKSGQVQMIELTDPGVARNLNTKADYEQYMREMEAITAR